MRILKVILFYYPMFLLDEEDYDIERMIINLNRN